MDYPCEEAAAEMDCEMMAAEAPEMEGENMGEGGEM